MQRRDRDDAPQLAVDDDRRGEPRADAFGPDGLGHVRRGRVVRVEPRRVPGLAYGGDYVIGGQREPLAQSPPGAAPSEQRRGTVHLEAGDRHRVAVQECRDLVRERAKELLRSGPLSGERRDPPEGRLLRIGLTARRHLASRISWLIVLAALR
jgi:hypothetical protein